MPAPVGIVFTTTGRELPAPVAAWLESAALELIALQRVDDLMMRCLRGRPRILIVDSRDAVAESVEACRRMKLDSYTAVVPAVIVSADDADALSASFASGADEVLREGTPPLEVRSRLDAALLRSDRDVQVHPTTRLPGTVAIEAELTRRLGGQPFAVAYADLDHFKEYNDRYGYHEGDRVIRVLSGILHDVVKGMVGDQGFVGHIGGDDFIFMTPAAAIPEVCAEIINVFDLLAPYQYSEADRRAGYFFGKDRRGQLHRVPLMTLSIGVVTNERRHFTTPSQVSELATEMKSYAKTLPGSVFSVDRRHDMPGAGPETSHATQRSLVRDER